MFIFYISIQALPGKSTERCMEIQQFYNEWEHISNVVKQV